MAKPPNPRRGGARPGAGRPRGEPTRRLSVPLSLVPAVTGAIAQRTARLDEPPQLEATPAFDPPALTRPLFGARVAAGFPSPADDHVDASLDLHDYLIAHPAATFYVRVSGDSMIGAGINPNDVLIVDRAREAQHNDIVVAVVDGELTVKRLYRRADGVALHPENRRYRPILIGGETALEIWGVVAGVVRKY